MSFCTDKAAAQRLSFRTVKVSNWNGHILRSARTTYLVFLWNIT